MIKSIPFLLFDGDCAVAMTFYHSCLGGDLTLTKLGDTPMKDAFPAEKHERIINATIKNGAIYIAATDWMASPQYDRVWGNNSAIFLLGEDADELKAVFHKLAAKAKKDDRFQDLHQMPFGTFGQFYDQFGTQWIFTSR